MPPSRRGHARQPSVQLSNPRPRWWLRFACLPAGVAHCPGPRQVRPHACWVSFACGRSANEPSGPFEPGAQSVASPRGGPSPEAARECVFRAQVNCFCNLLCSLWSFSLIIFLLSDSLRHLSCANTTTCPLLPLPGNAHTLVGTNTITCTTLLVLFERIRDFFRQTNGSGIYAKCAYLAVTVCPVSVGSGPLLILVSLYKALFNPFSELGTIQYLNS